MKHQPTIPTGPDGKTAGQRDREAVASIQTQRKVGQRIVLAMLLAGMVALGAVLWSER